MTTKNPSTQFIANEISTLANHHIQEIKRYSNVEAFNVTTDIRMERFMPLELQSPVALSKRFEVNPMEDFDSIYNQVVEKLNDPDFQSLD